MDHTGETNTRRGILAGAGTLAGLAFWLLVDVIPDIVDNTRVLLTLAVATFAFFSTFLLTLGHLSLRQSAMASAFIGALTSLATLVSSFRFTEAEDYLETGHPFMALFVLLSVPLPFLVTGLGPKKCWLSYPDLFEEAWELVVRLAAAFVFTGAVWAIIFLSNLLFELVGLTIIEDLLDIDAVPFLITGCAGGIALAAAFELREVMGPDLAIRLLRLLLPVVLIVTVVFLVMLPFQGLSGLFGELSAAVTLMLMAVLSFTLVSSAVDRSEDTAAEVGILAKSARALAALSAALGVLSVVAVWLRVAQYGWTPDRFAAMTGAVITAGYGVLYLASAVRGSAWQSRIRRGNIWMALALIGIGFLWITPVLNVQALSTASQMARFEGGETSVEDLDLWALGREWGRPGERAIERLRTMDHPDKDRLDERLVALDNAVSRYTFRTETNPVQAADDLARVLERMPVFPAGATLPDGVFEGGIAGRADDWLEACERKTPAGRPGCVALVDDFIPTVEGQETFILTMVSDTSVNVDGILAPTSGMDWRLRSPTALSGNFGSLRTPDAIDALHDGRFTIRPTGLRAFEVDGKALFIIP